MEEEEDEFLLVRKIDPSMEDAQQALLDSTEVHESSGGGAGSCTQSECSDEAVVMSKAAKKPPRLQFLDVLRGLTIAWMILVDNAGYSFPMIDHCPWDGIALADFVMPNFDFIVGVSCTLSLKKFVSKSRNDPMQRWAATRKICVRSTKLFIIVKSHTHHNHMIRRMISSIA